MKPKVFIGSSKEFLDIAEAIHSNLSDFSFPDIWDQSITTLSNSTLKNLIETLSSYDFAIFILGGEDSSRIRGDIVNISRDNVIFELGLFMGKLGPDHVFIVKPNNINIHIPTDLLGITYGEYDHNHPNKESALRKFCGQVKTQIKSIYQPTIPRNGRFGENILNDGLIKLNSNDRHELSSPTYGLYAETSPTQRIKIIMENLSPDSNHNLWFYDTSQKAGWIPDTYTGKQTFELLPHSVGLLKLFFQGVGKAVINVFLNDDLIQRKEIYWDK